MNAWLAFIDESGVLMTPLVRRTWALAGETPILQQRTRHHQKVSVIAAVVVSPSGRYIRLYFRLHSETSIRTPAVVSFLHQLNRQIGRRFFVIWDRLKAHRSAKVSDFLTQRAGSPPFFLPTYAPELNPVEIVWGYLKTNRLANFAPHEFPDLIAATRRHTRSIQRSPLLLRSFFAHSPLFFGPA